MVLATYPASVGLTHLGVGVAARRGTPVPMPALSPDELDFSDAWIDGDDGARWRSASAHGPGTGAVASGSSVIEIGPGRQLPEHTDSAEETIVVIAGVAEVHVGEEVARVPAGGLALVPKDVVHEVRNAGSETLRFAAVYAGADVVTTYREPVQPAGEREREPVG
jgi:quercetin dioxygenase-like cupin family protein